LCFETFFNHSYSSFALNFVWVIVALYGLGWAHRRKPAKLTR